MANPRGNPQNLKRPVKGGPSPNPKGRGVNPFNAAFKKLTISEFEDIANLIVKGNLEALKEIAKNSDSSTIKVWVASCVIKAIQKGDFHGLDILLNRLVGKVRDTIHHTGDGSAPTPIVNVVIPSNGREVKK